MLHRKIAEVRDSGAQVLASGNPGCVLHIGAGLRLAALSVPVAHPVDLLRRALPDLGS